MEAYALFVSFGVKPAEYLGLDDVQVDKIRERAFLLACLSKYQDEQKGETAETAQDSGLTMSPEAAQALIEERRFNQ